MPTEVAPALENSNAAVQLVAIVVGLAITLWGATGGRRWWQARKVRDQFWETFMADWMGQPARPGFAARPGVMESLLQIRTEGAALSERLRKAEVEILSLRSQMTAMHNRVASVESKLPAHPEDEKG